MEKESPRKEPFAEHNPAAPPHAGRELPYAVWGFFLLTAFSGIFLSVYYIPTFSQAFGSVERLNGVVPFGWLLRRLHAAGGGLLVIVMLLHLLKILYRGEYKAGPLEAWVLGVLFLAFSVWTNFTGSFLALSQSAFWGTAAVLSDLSTLPWVGGSLVDFFRGGKELGGTALVRFYSMHLGFAAFMALFLYRHTRRLAAPQEARADGTSRSRAMLFTLAIFGILLAVVTFAPSWFSDPLREAANPSVNPSQVSPPWYLLFLEESLKFFAGTYPTWTIIALVIGALLVLFLPYFDRSSERNILLRPVLLGCAAAVLIGVTYFTLVGTANARYGDQIVIPERALTAMELRGAQVYAEKNCAYCHQVFGRGGRREGPDMSVVANRGRTPEWTRRFILNARIYQPGTTMPRYEMPLEDLEALSAYLLSLDSRRGNFKSVERTRFLEASCFTPPGGPEGVQK